MREIVIRLRPQDVAAMCLVATLFGGGFAAVSAFTNAQNTSNGLPVVLPYQGTLTESTAQGGPVSGQRTMQFRLFDVDAPGGNTLYASSSRSVEVVDGRFSVVLGSSDWPGTAGNELEAADLRAPALWLELTMNDPQGGAPITFPRQRVAPAPQAVFASASQTSQTAAEAGAALAATGALRTELDALGASGLYCGHSPSQTMGRIVAPSGSIGQAGAREICQSVPGCGADAHMCTAHEMGLSSQRNLLIGLPSASRYWYQTMISFGYSGGTMIDCLGFTATRGDGTGGNPNAGINNLFGINFANAYGGIANISYCEDSAYIACCR